MNPVSQVAASWKLGTNPRKERAPFLDKLKPDLSLNFGSRKNSATTTVNSSPIILQQEFVPFDWNLLQSRFPGGVDKDNWKDLRDHLPEDIRFNFKFNPPIEGSDASPTWTFHPSGLSTKTSIPLQLKGYSVIIPAPTSPRVVTGSIPPADPRAEELIDPSLELDDDTVNTIFEIYSFAIGFYLFLDGNLQILVPLGFDSASKSGFFSSRFRPTWSACMADAAFISCTLPKPELLWRPESRICRDEFDADVWKQHQKGV